MAKLRGHYRMIFLIVILALVAYIAYNLTSSPSSKTLSKNDLAARDFAKHSMYKPASQIVKQNVYKTSFNDDTPVVIESDNKDDIGPDDMNMPPVKLPPQPIFYSKPMAEPVSLYQEVEKDFLSYFDSKERLVHLDLKGAPPKVQYYENFFPLIKRLGATGLLIEYEDMFPYSGNLSELAAGHHYSVNDIQHMLKLASDNSLQVIPLVQTFGHMEFVLKYETFRHLREDSTTPQIICPTLEESSRLLQQMIDQVMALHPVVKYIHIGSDEVYQLGLHRSKQYLKDKNMTAEELFFEHVTRVARYIIKRHDVQPIMWDDMFRHIDQDTLVKSKIADVVQPMVWSYGTHPYELLGDEIWSRYGLVFHKVWIASSFKGATGSAQFANNITHHLQNHFHWIEMMKRFDATDQRHLQFIGVALTGWQRYDHFSTLCELLPAALPSLAANLQTLKYGGFDRKMHTFISQELGCKSDMPLELDSKVELVTKCNFTGNEIYYGSRMLWNQTNAFEHYSIQSRLTGWLTDYNVKRHYGSPGQLTVLMQRLVPILDGLSDVKAYVEKTLTKIFGEDTREEWLEVQITARINTITELLRKIEPLLKVKVWPQRPLHITDDVPTQQGETSRKRSLDKNVVNTGQNQVLNDDTQGVVKGDPNAFKVPSHESLGNPDAQTVQRQHEGQDVLNNPVQQVGSNGLSLQGHIMKQFDKSNSGIGDRQLIKSESIVLPNGNIAPDARSQQNVIRGDKRAGFMQNQPANQGEMNANANTESKDKLKFLKYDKSDAEPRLDAEGRKIAIETDPHNSVQRHAMIGSLPDRVGVDNGDGLNAVQRQQRVDPPVDRKPPGDGFGAMTAANHDILPGQDTAPKLRQGKTLREKMSPIYKVGQSS